MKVNKHNIDWMRCVIVELFTCAITAIKNPKKIEINSRIIATGMCRLNLNLFVFLIKATNGRNNNIVIDVSPKLKTLKILVIQAKKK